MNLQELLQLRESVHTCIERSSRTLIWFAEHVVANDTIPLNAWVRLDRPLPRKSKTLGPAFDVWHAMLRAERTMRKVSPSISEELRKTSRRLKEKLESYTRPQGQSPEVYARLLVSDEIYGCFNGLTAASVLRSEVFPERAKTTPSYLAGHILLAELRIASERATAHLVTGIRDRFPGLYVVAQGVHSLMLYVEHLRRRAAIFRAFADELATLKRLADAMTSTGPALSVHVTGGAEANAVQHALDGYVRLALTRLASLAAECDSLLVSTRPFFQTLYREMSSASEAARPISFDHVSSIFVSAAQALSHANIDALFREQETVRNASDAFCQDLHVYIRNIANSLDDLFRKPTGNFAALHSTLQDLRRHLIKLELIQLAGTHKGQYPSIRDAARFQFAKMIVRIFIVDDTPEGTVVQREDLERSDVRAAVAKKLTQLKNEYSLQVPALRDGATGSEVGQFACDVMEALGRSAIGGTVVEWWKNYERCYRTGEWARLRHESFLAIRDLSTSLIRCDDARGIQEWIVEPLRRAANKESDVARRVETSVKELTQWCSSRGQQLLLAGKNGSSQAADVLDLIAAMWIADRIGEPWPERLEEQALSVVQELQNADGSFAAVRPLYQNRGFLFYVPSASTIALLARFATCGTQAPRQPEQRRRLKRWAPVLVKGTEFLIASMVGGARPRLPDDGSELPGWHSDRHPEPERVDYLATTEAITALSRLDDALTWLVNFQVIGELQAMWPNPSLSMAIPTDCATPPAAQLLPKLAPLIRRLRTSTMTYTNTTDEIGVDTPRESNTFVFYGPPGTGKTYAQEIIAGELGWPVVTLTIGDFLQDGVDRIGRRAEEMFNHRLIHLSNACIVFDEFDEMIADRGREGGVPLLTAAMLPLLTGLREHTRKQSCAVSFTTNYIENIDQAATRGGRVDEEVLLTYPDYPSRLLMALVTQLRMPSQSRQEHLGAESNEPLPWDRILRIARETAFCTYPSICEYAKTVLTAPETAELRPPKPPIDAAYYGRIETANPRLRESLTRLFAAVGPDLNEWLQQHPDWVPLYRLAGGDQPLAVEGV